MPETVTLEDALQGFQSAASKYEVLGIEHTATANEVRVAFRRLALLYHPDRHPEEDRPLAHSVFSEIASAYRVLSDPRERTRYDYALTHGEDYRESAEESEGMTLRDVLAGILRFEHVFSERSLAAIDIHLRDTVVVALIDELQEQVVAVYKMRAAPTGATHRGTFTTGAMVVTNLRVLLPFMYSWEEAENSQTVKYTGISMPNVALPSVTRIVIEQQGMASPSTVIRIETGDTQTAIQSTEADVAKILVVCRLWAIPVEGNLIASRAKELRHAVFAPIGKVAFWTALVLAASSAWAIFDGGFIDNPVWVLSTGAELGVWQILFWLCALVSARRLWRFYRAYSAADLVGLLSESAPPRAEPDERSLATTA